MKNFKPVLGLLISAFLLTTASCRESFYKCEGVSWGTTYSIIYRGVPVLEDSVRAILRQVDNSLSMFNPASGVSRLNRGETRETDSLFRAVYYTAALVHRFSEGRFDPTVAPLVDLWGFGRVKRPEGTPAPEQQEIDSVLTLVGMDATGVDGGRLIAPQGTQFDFSALAKGYGVDLVGEMFSRNGVEDYMIEIGGEIRLQGQNPFGRQWQIQVDAPVVERHGSAPGHQRLTVLSLGPECTALASSGNYRNYRTDSLGRAWGHTLSPLTGRPVQSPVLSATVIDKSGNCALADALATATMAQEDTIVAARMIRRAGATAILVVSTETGEKVMTIF